MGFFYVMKNILSLLLLALFLSQCNSQKVDSAKYNESKSSGKNILLGKWQLTERNYQEGNVKVNYPLNACEKQYNWVFEKQNENYFLTKNYFSGNNCSIQSATDQLKINIGEGNFTYLEADLKVNQQYQLITSSKMIIKYNEILDGKVREIEDTYIKK